MPNVGVQSNPTEVADRHRRAPARESLYQVDRMLKTSFCFLKASSDTCVAGQVESNHGNLRVYGLRPQ
jgi:hypothetical protein